MLKAKLLTLPESNLIVFCSITEDVNHPGIFCVHLSQHFIKKLPKVCPLIMLNHPAEFKHPSQLPMSNNGTLLSHHSQTRVMHLCIKSKAIPLIIIPLINPGKFL